MKKTGITFRTQKLEDLDLIAQFMRQYLIRSGDILLVEAPMGGGKTTFARALAAQYGLQGISSPTFTISNLYQAPGKDLSMVHLDLYRLGSIEEFFDAGLDETLENLKDDRAFAYMEWPDLLWEGRIFTASLRSCATSLRHLQILPHPASGDLVRSYVLDLASWLSDPHFPAGSRKLLSPLLDEPERVGELFPALQALLSLDEVDN